MYRTAIVTFVSNTSFVSHSYFLFISGQENCNLSERNCITMVGLIISLHFIPNDFEPFLNISQQRTIRNIRTWIRM